MFYRTGLGNVFQGRPVHLSYRALKESGDSRMLLSDDEALDVAQVQVRQAEGGPTAFTDGDDRHRLEVLPEDRLGLEADVRQAQLEVPLES